MELDPLLLRARAERDAARTRVHILEAEVDRLKVELERAALDSIAARNPGIDMDRVRASRAEGT